MSGTVLAQSITCMHVFYLYKKMKWHYHRTMNFPNFLWSRLTVMFTNNLGRNVTGQRMIKDEPESEWFTGDTCMSKGQSFTGTHNWKDQPLDFTKEVNLEKQSSASSAHDKREVGSLFQFLNSVSSQCACGKSSIARKPEDHPKRKMKTGRPSQNF